MDDSSEKKLSFIRKKLLENSTSPATPHAAPASVAVHGNGNIVGNGNVVVLVQPPFPPAKAKKTVVVQTGVGVLDAAQKAQINSLVDEWVKLRGSIRSRAAEIRSLRAAFNKAMKVNSYAEIKQEDFGRAVSWLKRQIAILDGMSSAPAKDPQWRTKRYRGINARAKEFGDGEARYRQYAATHFGTSSLRDLTDDQLDAVYRYVFGWPRSRGAKA